MILMLCGNHDLKRQSCWEYKGKTIIFGFEKVNLKSKLINVMGIFFVELDQISAMF